jgi:predicted enzyme related to lactoylglutathione lyase
MDARYLCTVILAKNYPRLVRWYKKALKMKIRRVVTEGYDWTELERKGLRIGITTAKQMGVKLPKKRANAVILHLVTKDVRGLLKQVKKAGGKVVFGPTYSESGKYWYGAFHDIEDNDVWVIDLDW